MHMPIAPQSAKVLPRTLFLPKLVGYSDPWVISYPISFSIGDGLEMNLDQILTKVPVNLGVRQFWFALRCKDIPT